MFVSLDCFDIGCIYLNSGRICKMLRINGYRNKANICWQNCAENTSHKAASTRKGKIVIQLRLSSELQDFKVCFGVLTNLLTKLMIPSHQREIYKLLRI